MSNETVSEKSTNASVKADKARVDRLKEQLRSTTPEVDFERIRIMKEVYESTQGDQNIMRRAKFMATLLERKKLYIDDNCFVGSMASTVNGIYTYPEWNIDWMKEDNTVEKCKDPEDKKVNQWALDYWEKRALKPRTLEIFEKKYGFDPKPCYESGFVVSFFDWPGGGGNLNYPRIYNHGLAAMIKEVEERQAALDMRLPNADTVWRRASSCRDCSHWERSASICWSWERNVVHLVVQLADLLRIAADDRHRGRSAGFSQQATAGCCRRASVEFALKLADFLGVGAGRAGGGYRHRCRRRRVGALGLHALDFLAQPLDLGGKIAHDVGLHGRRGGRRSGRRRGGRGRRGGGLRRGGDTGGLVARVGDVLFAVVFAEIDDVGVPVRLSRLDLLQDVERVLIAGLGGFPVAAVPGSVAFLKLHVGAQKQVGGVARGRGGGGGGQAGDRSQQQQDDNYFPHGMARTLAKHQGQCKPRDARVASFGFLELITTLFPVISFRVTTKFASLAKSRIFAILSGKRVICLNPAFLNRINRDFLE